VEKEYIFTESPADEMWQTLLHFSYEANIKKYLSEHGFGITDELVNNISGSILQAHEYYSASTHANLQIKPLLLYYGTTNLLYGICNMLLGSVGTIHNHGMQITLPAKGDYIGNTEISFENSSNGGVHVFSRALGYNTDLTKYGKWKIREMLASIPELHNDYLKCYGEKLTHTHLLNEYLTPEGKLEKLHVDSRVTAKEMVESLKNVEGFSASYLSPVVSGDNCDLILRHKLSGKNIARTSYSGQPYFAIGHQKQGQLLTLPQLLYMYTALFSLSSLCRYNPEIWSPFVKQDNTGEKLLIEKFLYYAKRLIPNYVVNCIYNKEIVYTSDKYAPVDTIKLVGEHQVRDLITTELRKQEERRAVRRVFEK